MTAVNDVAIIGGGIGGMTLAAMLQRSGIRATVYEQAPEIREVGAGIVVWAGPGETFAHLGLTEKLQTIGQCLETAAISTHQGADLLAMEVDAGRKALGYPMANHIVHRAELLAILATAVDPATVHTGARCVAVEPNGLRPTARFADGREIAADLIVGADGIHSVVRHRLWGAVAPDYAGEVCWRGVATIDWPLPHCLREVQGPALRFGICPLTKGRVYWWATEVASPDLQVPVETRREHLLARFGQWPFGIPDLIAATPPEGMLLHGLYDRPKLTRWHQGAITLVGDAAHPTTPNLGQGANMAMEDAAWLGRCLAEGDDLMEALNRYETRRIPFHDRIVRMSRLWGDVGQWRHPLAVAAREWTMRLSGPLSRRTFADQMRSGLPPWPAVR